MADAQDKAEHKVDAELHSRYGVPSEEESAKQVDKASRRPAWVETLPMPFMIACALLGPRFLVTGEIGYLAALGLGFACALAGGVLITVVIVLIHKLFRY